MHGGGRLRQAATVLLTVLLVTATFAPVAAYPTDEPGLSESERETIRTADAALHRFTAFAEPTPRQQKRAAVATVGNLSADREPQRRARDRAARLLNGTLAEYRDGTRVDTAAVFRNDSAAVRALTRFERGDEQARSRVETATRLVVRGDDTTAATAISDAERVLTRSRDRDVNVGAVRSAEAHIRNAERAYERGQAALSGVRDQPFAKRVRARARAIEQFRIAWQQSQLAIDRLDRATSPRVTIQNRDDPFRNGTESTTRRLVGTVEDPQAYELANATVRVNGGPERTITLNTSSAPGTNATFETTVEFTQRITTVNVTVVDVGVREDDEDGEREGDEDDDRDREGDDGDRERGPPENAGPPSGDDDDDDAGAPEPGGGPPAGAGPPDETGDDEDDDESERATDDITRQVGTDILRLDGDGLPDRYEQAVTETDPLDPDSDSDRTSANEADDGTVDGAEDFDDDTLITFDEYVFDTDPFAADTDGDGLADRVEVTFSSLDPTLADTDGDGTLDPDEDTDSDGLDTRAEIDNGTSPTAADTDLDGLEDGREVREVGTDPRAPDTDEDGLTDATELRLGTDPLVADTDGDGIVDSNETFTTTARNAAANTTVAVTGQGDVASGVTIRADNATDLRTPGVETARASPFVQLESAREFQQAEVTIEYNESRAGSESQLALYTYNRTLGTFVRLDSTVDAANDTVTATTTGFSRFVVFNVENWGEVLSAQRPEEAPEDAQPGQVPVDVAFVLDSSGSMRGNDPNDLRLVGSKRFVGALIEGDRAAVVDFDSRARLLQGLTTDLDAANRSIDRIDSFGGTNIGAGIRTANAEFDRASNDSRAKVMIVLSDGFTFPESSARRQAERAAARNITIYTIGFGNPDRRLLRDIAAETGGSFTFVQDVNDLPEVFSRIAENTTGPTDSDGDGLSDAVERQGFVGGRGEQIQTDPFDADTDNDGLEDGQETATFVNVSDDGTQVDLPEGTIELPEGQRVSGDYYKLNSDPTVVDTDGDGLSDFEETRETQSVQLTDEPSDTTEFIDARRNGNDGGQYLTTIEATSDPYLSDTDADFISDGEEVAQGTAPDRRDTDGDGITDFEESQATSDPTLFDNTAPTVEIRSLSANAAKTEYDVTYVVTDQSGVEEIQFRKGGELQTTRAFGGVADTGVVTTEFTVPTEDIGDLAGLFARATTESILGVKVTARVADVHGNAKTNTYRGPSSIAATAEYLAKAVPGDRFDAAPVFYVAQIAGVTLALGQTVSDLVRLVTDPIGFVDQLVTFANAIREEPGLVARLPELFLSSIVSTQQTQNPFDDLPRQQSQNATFSTGWYTGYAGGFIIEAVVGPKGSTKLLDALSEASSTVRRVRQAVGGLKTAFRGATVGPAKRLSISAARQLADIGYNSRVVRGALESVTAVRQRALTTALQSLDTVGSGLDDVQQRVLTRVLRRTDADADTTDVIRRLDNRGELDEYLSIVRCSVGRGSIAPRIATDGGVAVPAGAFGSASAPTLSVAPSCPLELGDVDAETALRANRNLKRALEDGDLSANEFTRVADRIFDSDADAAVLVRTLANGDDDAAKFVADADPEALADYTALRNEPGIEEDTLREFAQTADEFDATGRDRAAIIEGLADADDDALENFFRFGGRSSGEVSEGLAQSVRRRLVPEYNNGRLSADALGEIGDDIDTLDTDSRVSGVDRVLRSVVDAETVSRQNFLTQVRGNLYEIRTARRYIRGRLRADDELQLSFRPFEDADGIDFQRLLDDDEQIAQLAEEVNLDETQVRENLKGAVEPGGSPEFDGFRITTQDEVVYYESKSGAVTESDIQKKATFLKAYEQLSGAERSELVVLSRLPDGDTRIENGVVEYLQERIGYGRFERVPWEYEQR